MRNAGILIIVISLLSLAFAREEERIVRKDKLSEYQFFTGEMNELKPAPEVEFYSVNMPLFSNYAEKIRFVKMPAGTYAVFRDSTTFDFPLGTILIKNFYYPDDFRKPAGRRKIIETRLLVHQPEGWEAWPYRWNDEQTDAEYDPAGGVIDVSYVNAQGKRVTTPYAIPNKNQCKGCHISNQKMKPIGTTARQLNGEVNFSDGKINQLIRWKNKNMIVELPAIENIQRLPSWTDPGEATLNDRARAYLDANCGHCHTKYGPANTSGLFLDYFERNAAHLGVHKSPVAAGRGAGNLRYDIVPGQPAQSILLYRMKATDPAIAMPEIGREQIHEEGVRLVEEWIRKNSF